MLFFKFQKENNRLRLEVTFDLENFLTTTKLNINTARDKKAFQYLNTNCNWIINQKQVKIKLKNFNKDDNHFTLVVIQVKLQIQSNQYLK